MSRLRWKLLLAMLAVVVVTVGLSALFTRRVTHQEIRKLIIAAPDGRIVRTLQHKEPLVEIAALDRRLIITFAGATLVAILLTLLVSQRITQPVERLTTAVNEMARGERPSHVAVAGHDEIAQLAQSFNSMADAIARQQELRRRMVGDVAHELRTPLTNLRCELEAIQDGLGTADIASIHEEVLHLSRLVDDLQELAVADAGGLRLQREPIDLAAIVARIVDERVDLTTEPITVNADPMRIRQIVRNLLSNAVQHTPDRGRVAVRVWREGKEAFVSVADSGPGIPASELDHIFERFYRLDQSRGRDSGGAGLGLAIVKQLVELHGGRVWAESSSEGATFTFSVPASS